MKISVITVCLNAANHIAQTIASVLGQDYQDLEYIIVDGGSSDGTLEVIRGYQGDSRLRLCSEPDDGIAAAMNKGVSLATGELFAHLNADDYYAHRQVASRVAGCFRQHPASLWLTGGCDFVAENGTLMRSIPVRHYSFSRLVRGNILFHPATFIRREAFYRTGGFDETLHFCMDYDLFLHLGEISSPFLLDEQLSCFRVHAASRTIADSSQSYAEEFLVRSRFLRERGKPILWYRLDYQLKKHLNRLFYRKLLPVRDR